MAMQFGNVIEGGTVGVVSNDLVTGWRQPSTSHIKGTLIRGGRTWTAATGTSTSGYSSVTLNRTFLPGEDFELVCNWAHNYMGTGMIYGQNVSHTDYTGYSADGTGPYFGGLDTSGYPQDYDETHDATYIGLYHSPISDGGISTSKVWFKYARLGNVLSLQYSTTGNLGLWNDVISPVTIDTNDKVVLGIGEASGTEVTPCMIDWIRYRSRNVGSGEIYGVRTFTSSGTFRTKFPLKADIFLVGGGGGGATGNRSAGATADAGGGGGAGAYRHHKGVILKPGSYTITIGGGGDTNGSANGDGAVGGNTTFDSGVNLYTANGGGGGARPNQPGNANGNASGGGAGGGGSTPAGGAGGTYGNAGGNSPGGAPYSGAAGGGAGAVGAASSTNGGAGGTGKYNTIRAGVTVAYGGGGGGGAGGAAATQGVGGSGGGGSGGLEGSNASAGDVNTGGGGGGASAESTYGGGGGSGIAIIRYGQV